MDWRLGKGNDRCLEIFVSSWVVFVGVFMEIILLMFVILISGVVNGKEVMLLEIGVIGYILVWFILSMVGIWMDNICCIGLICDFFIVIKDGVVRIDWWSDVFEWVGFGVGVRDFGLYSIGVLVGCLIVILMSWLGEGVELLDGGVGVV